MNEIAKRDIKLLSLTYTNEEYRADLNGAQILIGAFLTPSTLLRVDENCTITYAIHQLTGLCKETFRRGPIYPQQCHSRKQGVLH